MRTVRATLDEQGRVALLEPLPLGDKRQPLLTILDATPTQELRLVGLYKGEFRVSDDFDTTLPESWSLCLSDHSPTLSNPLHYS